jgi:hypothetical protein
MKYLWIPAFAGMTKSYSRTFAVIDVICGYSFRPVGWAPTCFVKSRCDVKPSKSKVTKENTFNDLPGYESAGIISLNQNNYSTTTGTTKRLWLAVFLQFWMMWQSCWMMQR